MWRAQSIPSKPRDCAAITSRTSRTRNVAAISTARRNPVPAAVTARSDANFVIIARTDARASGGLDEAITRGRAYVEARADMIFPEALADEGEFEKFRKAVSVPLLANMTELGKTKLLTTTQLSGLGVNVVFYPVTTLRLAMLQKEGTQASLLDRMQTRAELYELLRYQNYADGDRTFGFIL